jgi:hypothetical protein
VSGIGSVAYGMVQSVRPDLLFKVHLAELPFYFLAFIGLIGAFGRDGAAMAWSLRAAVDAALLFAVLYRLRLISLSSALPIVRPTVISLAVFLAAVQLDDLAMKVAFYVAAICVLAVLAWFRLLEHQERRILRSRVRSLLRPSSRTGVGEAEAA